MNAVWEIARALAVFALVAGLAYAASRFLGERLRQRGGGRRLEVVEAIALGSRRHVCLVRVGEDLICLGLSEREMTPLARFRGEAARRLLAAEGTAARDEVG